MRRLLPVILTALLMGLAGFAQAQGSSVSLNSALFSQNSGYKPLAAFDGKEAAAPGFRLFRRVSVHVERTRLLLHLVDGSAEDPLEAWRVVRSELDSYGAGLAQKPEIIALTKADLLDDNRRMKIVTALEKATRARVFPISAPIEEGLEPLLDDVIGRLGAAREEEGSESAAAEHWSPL